MNCKNCKWAEWQFSPAGRILRSVAGRCNYVIDVPAVPYSAEVRINKKGIWPNVEIECDCFELKK